jgi:hypothetical protein
VTLPVARDVRGLEISDRALIDDACRDLSRGDKVAGPGRYVRINVVIERRRQRFLQHERAAVNAQEARRRTASLHLKREITTHDRLGRLGLGRQTTYREIGDLARPQRAWRNFAQDLGDDVERAHAEASVRIRLPISATTRSVVIEAPSST